MHIKPVIMKMEKQDLDKMNSRRVNALRNNRPGKREREAAEKRK